MKKVLRKTVVKVGGFDTTVKTVAKLNYQGIYEYAGYDVYLGLKYIGNFWGHPTAKDIKKLIDSEVKVS
jgi:hypothetical protein